MSSVPRRRALDRFPLLRLPFLALEKVLRTMPLYEKINLSRTSEKCKRLAKLCSRGTYRLDMYILDYELVVCIKGDERVAYKFGRTIVREEHKYWSSSRNVEFLYLEPQNVWERFRKQVEFIKEILNVEFAEIQYNFNHQYGDNKGVIDWIGLQTAQVQDVFLFGFNVSPDGVIFFFNNVRVKKFLRVNLISAGNQPIFIPHNVEELDAIDARWLTLEGLLELDTQKISVLHHQFSNQDLHILVQKWMTSEALLNLEYITITVRNRDAIAHIIRDIAHEVIDLDALHLFLDRFPVHQVIAVFRNDGKFAYIFPIEDRGNIKMVMATNNKL